MSSSPPCWRRPWLNRGGSRPRLPNGWPDQAEAEPLFPAPPLAHGTVAMLLLIRAPLQLAQHHSSRAHGRRSVFAAPLSQGFCRLPRCQFDSLLTRSRGGKIIPPSSQARNAQYPPSVSRENFMDRARTKPSVFRPFLLRSLLEKEAFRARPFHFKEDAYHE